MTFGPIPPCRFCGVAWGSVHNPGCPMGTGSTQPLTLGEGAKCPACQGEGYHVAGCTLAATPRPNLAEAPPTPREVILKVINVYRDLGWSLPPEKMADEVIKELHAHGYDLA